MPTTIDAENLKDIRQPMKVDVTLAPLPPAGWNMETYVYTSGSTKSYPPEIVDLSTLDDDYNLAVLTDLFEPFPLDGSHVLYDDNGTGMSMGGKVGMRAQVYHSYGTVYYSDPMGLHISADNVIGVLTIKCFYCASIKVYRQRPNYGYSPIATYTPVDGEDLMFNVDYDEIWIRFERRGTNHRMIVQNVLPGLSLKYDETSIVSVNMNLRSDLNPIDPTFPESEIIIKAYEPNDITQLTSLINQELPIRYSAGYDGQMSETRTFYLSEPLQWKDNLLTMKAVDAVHLLDETCPTTFIGRMFWEEEDSPVYYDITSPHKLIYMCAKDQIDKAGISAVVESDPPVTCRATSSRICNSMFEAQSRREVLANLINLWHHSYANTSLFGISNFHLNYVDAGIPKLSWSVPQSKWDIYEEDCGDVEINIEQKIGKIKTREGDITIRGYFWGVWSKSIHSDDPINTNVIGSYKYSQNDSAQISLNEYTNMPFVWAHDGDESKQPLRVLPIVGGTVTDFDCELPAYSSNMDNVYGKMLHKGDYWQGWGETASGAATPSEIYNTATTRGYINSQTGSLKLAGGYVSIDRKQGLYSTSSGQGRTVELSKTEWLGKMSCYALNGSLYSNFMPNYGWLSIFLRSNETGSFTWKGDPRMQPRDVFTFHYIDGTTELRTIESIELNHNGGGTSAKITYRKGVV